MVSRVLILAAGQGTRWGNFRGTQKHLLKIEGETLVARQVRQFSQYTSDIIIVGLDESYETPGARLFVPACGDSNWLDMAKFWSSQEMWSEDRTVLVFGDVYFTDEAVMTIMTNTDPLKFFLRKGPSKLTGKRYKEIFGLGFDGSSNDVLRSLISEIIEARYATKTGGWFLYRKLLNTINQDPAVLFGDDTYYVNIDDWTEDFDYPDDVIVWETNKYGFSC